MAGNLHVFSQAQHSDFWTNGSKENQQGTITFQSECPWEGLRGSAVSKQTMKVVLMGRTMLGLTEHSY